MEHASLNLARKWRSAQFGEIVGQDLVVRILQNSLFKNQFFPVYLLSGQRGCGKTSTARVFAAALNCHKLSEFQKKPSIKIPCLQCQSCIAMTTNQHPDFIEIDAASYTGVDNIRNIIDTSSFLPILGSKKIYLIDEVHMLSKAAFNAFLKILEEPPKFVVFILATTEVQKLPDTVRSRCFQLFFNAVASTMVTDHLESICKKESIAYERAGLEMIAQVTQGSLRDAINLLEQARFASNNVSKSVVLSVLGYPDDAILISLLQSTLNYDQLAVMHIFALWTAQVVSIDYVVKRCIELLYDAIALKYQAQPKYAMSMSEDLKTVIESVCLQSLLHVFDLVCDLDHSILKTTKKQLLFEAALIRFVLKREAAQNSLQINHAVVHDEKKNSEKAITSDRALWDMFVKVVVAHIDPVLASILYATEFKEFNREQNMVFVATLKKFVLFQDLFIEQKKQYQEYLDRIFGFATALVVDFSLTSATPKTAVVTVVSPQIASLTQTISKKEVVTEVITKEIIQSGQWNMTRALLECFGGSVREMAKDTHEQDA